MGVFLFEVDFPVFKFVEIIIFVEVHSGDREDMVENIRSVKWYIVQIWWTWYVE